MPTPADRGLMFCGQPVDEQQFQLVEHLVQCFGGLSRTELAATICEQLGWLRPSGKPKTVECRQWLEALAERALLDLPPRRCGRPKGSTTAIAAPAPTPSLIDEPLNAIGPIRLERVAGRAAHAQWRALIEQYHPLGHRVPFGASLRYRIESARGVLGGLQFSSPAWRLHSRDQWIGWDDSQRRHGLQQIVCNSRFLIRPEVRVAHLASHVLGQAARRIATDWAHTFGVTPWLLETLIDPAHYRGVSYRAANWIAVGLTRGRGRNDRAHQRHGAAPKQVWLYPLVADARQRLRGV
jgi:hypothetical protein